MVREILSQIGMTAPDHPAAADAIYHPPHSQCFGLLDHPPTHNAQQVVYRGRFCCVVNWFVGSPPLLPASDVWEIDSMSATSRMGGECKKAKSLASSCAMAPLGIVCVCEHADSDWRKDMCVEVKVVKVTVHWLMYTQTITMHLSRCTSFLFCLHLCVTNFWVFKTIIQWHDLSGFFPLQINACYAFRYAWALHILLVDIQCRLVCLVMQGKWIYYIWSFI